MSYDVCRRDTGPLFLNFQRRRDSVCDRTKVESTLWQT